jgi:hypothetical protein
MIGVIKIIRRIQLDKISYTPNLYTAIKTIDTKHPTEYDESDDIERTKTIKPKKSNWGEITINME